ncbi:MAG: type II secretion system protein [Methylococcales bacterium]|nr:type II secretion system protein [Methylococcales bacterium]
MLKNKQQGFTLIELVMVIVILGILAATALPKFVGLERSAKISSLKGLKGSMQSAATMIHAQALIDGVAHGQYVDINQNATATNADGDVRSIYSYPQTAHLQRVMDVDGFTVLNNGEFRLNGVNGCEVQYRQPANATSPPTYTITDTAC